jgi:prefoldin alpha subunit
MPEGPRDAQEAALTLELYQRQLDAVSRQIEFLQGVYDEILRAKRTIEGLDEAVNFMAGKVDPSAKVIVGIGAGYATERTRKEALVLLEQRGQQAESELQSMMQTAVRLQQEAARLSEGFDES